MIVEEVEQGHRYTLVQNFAVRKKMEFIPCPHCSDDLGAECIRNEDCKSKNCNTGCIAQICTPDSSQQRKLITIKHKYFPIVWFILALAVFILLPQIIIQGLKLTKVGKLPKIPIIVIVIVFFILCFIPILYLYYFQGKTTTVYEDKCTNKSTLQDNEQITDLCNAKSC
jgi:hypothetical protein